MQAPKLAAVKQNMPSQDMPSQDMPSAPTMQPTLPAQEGQDAIRILIVDDELINRRVLENHLSGGSLSARIGQQWTGSTGYTGAVSGL